MAKEKLFTMQTDKADRAEMDELAWRLRKSRADAVRLAVHLTLMATPVPHPQSLPPTSGPSASQPAGYSAA